jgi:rubrerythrin
VKDGHGWLSYETALKNGAPRTNAGLSIFQKESELTIRLKKNQTDINAVNIAIEAEDRAIEFYGNLLKQASSPQEKIVLTKLFEMEKGHLKLLRWESESLTKTGFWCGQIEYSVEKETE